MPFPGIGRAWHLIERPRLPYRCDVCGAEIPASESASFTTLPKMFYETPPVGYVPCNRGYDPLRAEFPFAVTGDDGR